MTQLRSPLIWRLTLWFLLLSLIPIGIVLVFVQRQVRNTVIDQQIQGLSDQARLLSLQMASQPEGTQEIMEEFGTEDITVFLLDEKGIYVAHSDPGKVGNSANNDIGADALQQLLNGQVTKINDPENVQYIGSAAVEESRIIAAIVADSTTQTQNIDGLSRRITLQLAISLLITSLAGGAAILVILNPIIQLSDFANRLGSGDMEAEFDTTDLEGEVATLAKNLNNLAVKVRNSIATLEQDVAERTRALQTSAEVSRRLSTFLNERQLIIEVVEQVKEAFDYYHVHIYMLDETSGDLVMAGGTGDVGASMLGSDHKILKGKGLVGRAAETNLPILVSNTSQEPDWLPNPLLPETNSEAAVPIAIADKVLGVLDVQHNEIDGLRQEDVNLLQSLANQIAIALLNARSYTEVQQHADREARVTSIIQKIQSTTTVEGALQVAARELGRTLNLNEIRVILEAPDWAEGSQVSNQAGS